ncbi:MAG: HI1506-related protein [Thiomicrospira sp.]
MVAQSVLKVRAATASFRRAGMVFTRDPRVIKVADLTDDQINAIKSEPNLVVVELDEVTFDQAGLGDAPADDAPPAAKLPRQTKAAK